MRLYKIRYRKDGTFFNPAGKFYVLERAARAVITQRQRLYARYPNWGPPPDLEIVAYEVTEVPNG